MIDTLSEKDRFTVVAFDDNMELPPNVAMAWFQDRTANVIVLSNGLPKSKLAAAPKWPGRSAGRQSTRKTLPASVSWYLRDGRPGRQRRPNPAGCSAQRLSGIRIFTLGIDKPSTPASCARSAAPGGGSFDSVESEDRLDEVMDKVQRRIGKPLWTGLKIEPNGIELDADSQVPSRLPDLFAGMPLTVLGRYRGKAQSTVTLRHSDDAGQPITRTMEAHVSVSVAPAKLWARGRLRDMEDIWVIGDYEDQGDAAKTDSRGVAEVWRNVPFHRIRRGGPRQKRSIKAASNSS